MIRTLRNLIVVVICVFSLPACNVFKNPTGPSGYDPSNPPPDQSLYEPLPAKQYLVDTDGNQTRMWATFISVSPARGSGITLGPGACPDGCFQYSMEVGIDGEAMDYFQTYFQTGLSHDGRTVFEGGGLADSNQCMSRSNEVIGGGFIIQFREVPEYLVVGASHCGRLLEEIVATTSFWLDYHPKQ